MRRPFEEFTKNPTQPLNWSSLRDYPRPDYLSSSRKRLAPQLLYKGGILHDWGKKQAVAVQGAFFATLPDLPRIEDASEAEMVWLVYDLVPTDGRFQLALVDRVYTNFDLALDAIARPSPGRVDDFLAQLQVSLDAVLVPSESPGTDEPEPLNAGFIDEA